MLYMIIGLFRGFIYFCVGIVLNDLWESFDSPKLWFLRFELFSHSFSKSTFFWNFLKTQNNLFFQLFLSKTTFSQNLKLKIQFFEKIEHFWKIRKKKNVGREGESIVPLKASGEGGKVAPHEGGRAAPELRRLAIAIPQPHSGFWRRDVLRSSSGNRS